MAKELDASEEDSLALSFGRRLATLREAAGLEGTELGRRVGMSQAHVWRLEAGRAVPNLRTMARLARLAVALDVTLASLVEEVDCSGVELRNRGYVRRDPLED